MLEALSTLIHKNIFQVRIGVETVGNSCGVKTVGNSSRSSGKPDL